MTEHDFADGALAAALLAVDPVRLGGAVVRGPPGPERDRWLAGLIAMLPTGAPVQRLPASPTITSLAGELDVAATLASGRYVATPGVLRRAQGGLVIVPMAERLEPAVAGMLAIARDLGQVAPDRPGLAPTSPPVFAVVALDESEPGEAGVYDGLSDRLAFCLEAAPVMPSDFAPDLAAARGRLRSVVFEDSALVTLCEAAEALGVASLRVAGLAMAAARASAALAGRATVADADLAVAARLVLAPRATRIPPFADPLPPEPPSPPPSPRGPEREPASAQTIGPAAERVLAAAAAALPSGLLNGAPARRPRPARGGKGGATSQSSDGRRIGSRPGKPGARHRLDLLDTVRAAAPWQRLRGLSSSPPPMRLRIRGSDFRVRRTVRKTGTTLIFVVDASGSSAAQRLAEAKGAVELLLAASYVRRDRVALVSFGGRGASLLLPPTRAAARARRALATMPGGGGTPLASGLEMARRVADGACRGAVGDAPLLLLLTDGRPNVARDGSGGRGRAETEALDEARAIRRAGHRVVVIDTGRWPTPFAQRLADESGGRYLPLPAADAAQLRRAALEPE
jgi:magnesium chelatase subunit D